MSKGCCAGVWRWAWGWRTSAARLTGSPSPKRHCASDSKCTCPSVCLIVCLSVCTFVCMSVCPSVCLSLCSSVHLSDHCRFICLPYYQSDYGLPVWLSVCMHLECVKSLSSDPPAPAPNNCSILNPLPWCEQVEC